MDGRGQDDRRMHEGDKPGLVPGRGHERHEEPVAEGDRIGREEGEGVSRDQAEAGRDTGASSATDRDQPSALGGDVATRSGTAPTPEEERSS